MQTDNAMADAVINGKVQPKRTKAMDMRFHWLQDRECSSNSEYTGNQENWITPITGPNTIQQTIIETHAKNS